MKLLDKVKSLLSIENITPDGKVLYVSISVLYAIAGFIFCIAFCCLTLDFIIWSIPNGYVIRTFIVSVVVALLGVILAIYSPLEKPKR